MVLQGEKGGNREGRAYSRATYKDTDPSLGGSGKVPSTCRVKSRFLRKDKTLSLSDLNSLS